MKRIPIIPLFIGIHVIYIALHIYKETLFIQESYTKQKQEKVKNTLDHTLQQVTQHLYTLQSYSHIEAFARTQLHMHPLTIHHIKQLPSP